MNEQTIIISVTKLTAIHTLRINAKSLAAEARFNREECKRIRNNDIRNKVIRHRKLRIRPEARITYLALAFARGIPYRKVEENAKTKPDAKDIEQKLRRHGMFGNRKLAEWLEQ